MTRMTLKEWLADEIEDGEYTARDPERNANNIYGAGYDAAFLAALKMVAERIGLRRPSK